MPCLPLLQILAKGKAQPHLLPQSGNAWFLKGKAQVDSE
jgi:hypothetical protein